MDQLPKPQVPLYLSITGWTLLIACDLVKSHVRAHGWQYTTAGLVTLAAWSVGGGIVFGWLFTYFSRYHGLQSRPWDRK